MGCSNTAHILSPLRRGTPRMQQTTGTIGKLYHSALADNTTFSMVFCTNWKALLPSVCLHNCARRGRQGATAEMLHTVMGSLASFSTCFKVESRASTELCCRIPLQRLSLEKGMSRGLQRYFSSRASGGSLVPPTPCWDSPTNKWYTSFM